MKYPKTLYQNVLLLDNKIVNWKTGTTHWKDVNKAFNNRQSLYILNYAQHKLYVKFRKKVVNTLDENNAFFNDSSWYKQFELHENFNVLKPY